MTVEGQIQFPTLKDLLKNYLVSDEFNFSIPKYFPLVAENNANSEVLVLIWTLFLYKMIDNNKTVTVNSFLFLPFEQRQRLFSNKL